jgi:cob(I)alamin adenosyltransferase
MSPSFYTRRGDDGYTGLLGEGRLPKESLRLEAVGVVDEANAALGVARSLAGAPGSTDLLLEIQRDLYGLMAELAALPENAARFRTIDSLRVAWLENQTDQITAQIEMPKEFIVPGDTVEGAFLDLARTVVRRAERRVAELLHQGEIENRELLRYLNRLSSFCFVLELQETILARKEIGTGSPQVTLAKTNKEARKP